MDLLTQRKMLLWAIGVLVALNLFSLTAVWIQMERREPPSGVAGRDPSALSTDLLQRGLELSPDQTKRYEQIRSDLSGTLGTINDKFDRLRTQVAEEIFNPQPDRVRLDSMIAEEGRLQSAMEELRFAHFRQLAEICDSTQKVRLQSILREVYSRRGPGGPDAPKPEQLVQQQPTRQESPSTRDGRRGGDRPERGKEAQGRRPSPPSLDEKLARYTQDLQLTTAQAHEVGRILRSIRAQEEAFKAHEKPTEAAFEREKARLRELEDAQIMKLLNERQKNEFDRMVKTRGDHPLR